MPNQTRIYLDHAATTPITTVASEAMMAAMARWANPSSPHSEGRAARAALEDARARIAGALGWSGDIIFTSGASEAIAIALRGSQAVASTVEHDAVLAYAGTAGLSVDVAGQVNSNAITKPARYAVQSVNNETGVSQPMAAIHAAIQTAGGTWLSDCSQSAGKIPLPDADLIAISAHKLGGPPGIGALLVRDLGLLQPNGGQEKGYRRGTENLPAVMGMAAALQADFSWLEEASRLRDWLDAAIIDAGGAIIGHASPRLATIASYHMPGVSASSQLIGFDMAGIAVSAGSACSSGTLKTSHVLKAMGWDAKTASEVIRVSFGPCTSANEVERFVEMWRKIAERAQAA